MLRDFIERRRKIIKGMAAVAVSAVVVAAMLPGSAMTAKGAGEKTKSETVYAVLATTGAIRARRL